MSETPPGAYPVDTLCKLFDLTPRRVQQLTVEGHLTKTGRGLYDLVASVKGYVKYLRELAERGAEKDPGGWDARRKRANAETAELELSQKRGEVVVLADIMESDQRLAATVRSGMLAIPGKAAVLIADKSTPAQREAIVRRLVDEALSALSSKSVTSEKRRNRKA